MKPSPPPIDAEEATRVDGRVRYFAGLACLNSVALGFQIGAVSAAAPKIQDSMNLTSYQLEMYEAAISAAAILGALLAGVVSEPVGRLACFQISSVLFVVGSLVQSFSLDYAMLMAGVTIVGVAVGFGLAVDPIYIAEISPKEGRGFFVTWSEVSITGGQVLGFAVGLCVEALLGASWGAGSWRLIIGCGCLTPLALLLAVALVLPESPRWLAIHGRTAEARAVLRRLGLNEARVDATLDDIAADAAAAPDHDVTPWGLLTSRRELKPAVRRILIVGIGTAVCQQLSGIDAVFYNFLFALEATGVETTWKLYGMLLGLGVVKLGTALLSCHLLDSVGRRPLVLTSAFGTAGFLFALAIAYAWCADYHGSAPYQFLILALFYLYTFFFELGLGPGCWLIPSEVFYNAIRMRAMTLATFANRVTTTGVVASAISIQNAWSWSGFFSWYGSTAGLAAAFLWIYMPETKGRSLEAMYAHFEEITNSREPVRSMIPAPHATNKVV